MAIGAGDQPAHSASGEGRRLLDMGGWPVESAVWLASMAAALITALAVTIAIHLAGAGLLAALVCVAAAAVVSSGVVWAALAPLRRLVHRPPARAIAQRGLVAQVNAQLRANQVAAPAPVATTPPAAATHAPVAPGPVAPIEAGAAQAAVALSADPRAAMIRLISRVGQSADSMRQQAATASQSMRRMETMAVSASSVSENTTAAASVASDAVFTVEAGQAALGKAQEAIITIRETTLRAARQVQVLGESAQFVRQAVVHVQDNADELHLIAGNASIEASRHPHSAGFFRSVADEIEQLAQQSQVALAEIQEAIEANRQETGRVVSVIEDVVVQVGRGADAVGAAGDALQTIEQVVGRLATLNRDSARVSQEQARDASAVAEGMDALVTGAGAAAREAAEQATLAARANALLENSETVGQGG